MSTCRVTPYSPPSRRDRARPGGWERCRRKAVLSGGAARGCVQSAPSRLKVVVARPVAEGDADPVGAPPSRRKRRVPRAAPSAGSPRRSVTGVAYPGGQAAGSGRGRCGRTAASARSSVGAGSRPPKKTRPGRPALVPQQRGCHEAASRLQLLSERRRWLLQVSQTCVCHPASQLTVFASLQGLFCF